MRTRTAVVIVVLALLATGCDWLQWGGAPPHRHSGYEPSLSRTNVVSFVESRMADVPTSSPAVIASGMVFVEQDGKLLALDAKTYAVAWTAPLPTGGTAGGAPAIFSDGAASTIFVVVSGATNPVLVGFDVAGVRNCNPLLFTCSPVFTAQLGSSPGPATPPLIDGNRLFVAGAGTLSAFDARGQTSCTTASGIATCNPIWSATTGFTAGGIGPTLAANVVYSPVADAGTSGIRAFDAATGGVLWTGGLGAAAVTATPSIGFDQRVYVPAGATIQVFAGNGCGSATCAPAFTLARADGQPGGDFRSTTAFDSSRVFATSAEGGLFSWPADGCGVPTCLPIQGTAISAPAGGTTTYSQTPLTVNGVAFLLVQRVINDVDHILLVALEQENADEIQRWDLGTGGFGAGLANATMAWGVIYAPVANALHAIHPPAVQPLASLSTTPLTLSPAFSTSVFDYTVRCATGTNSLTLTMEAEPGGTVALTAPTTTQPSASQTVTVQLAENQAAVIRARNAAGAAADYWVRCLPADFPALTVTNFPNVGTPSPGWYVMGNNLLTSGATSYAMILNTQGTPVWYRRVTPSATNVVPFARDSVAWVTGPIFFGFGIDMAGKFDAYSLATGAQQAFRTVGMPTDLHELYTRRNGNQLILSYPLKRGVDLTGLQSTPTPGPNSTIADCVVQEIDPQGNLVWQWTGSDHMDAVTEPTAAPAVTIAGETVYDVFHCNSIDVGPTGDVLVSVRHTNAVVEIRRSDGVVAWKLGGKPVNKDGAAIIAIQNDPEGSIVQQHDARYLPNGNISVFDNQSPTTGLPARGIEYSLDLTARTAQPVFSFTQPEGSAGCCMGSYRVYPDGHRVIGWGYVFGIGRSMTELDENGNRVLDIALPTNQASYRAVKVPPAFFNTTTLRNTAGR